VRCRYVAPRPSKPHAEPLLAIQPVHALVIDLPTFTSEQDLDAEVAVAHPRRGQSPNQPSQHGLIVAVRAVAVRRTVESQQRTSSALAHPVRPLQVPDQLAPRLRPHNFFLQHVLQHQIVEREVGDQLLEPTVLFLELGAIDFDPLRRCGARIRDVLAPWSCEVQSEAAPSAAAPPRTSS
jgi:hypothetical protein